MASGRFLSTSIADDDRLSRLSLAAEFVYLKTIPHLDRDGMISGKPGLLYSKACPLREELFGKTADLIDEWVKVGLVVRFETDEGPVLFFPGFGKNNKLPHYERERPSRFPVPPGYIRTKKGIQLHDQLQEQVNEPVPNLGTEEQEEDKEQDKDKEEEKAAAAAAAGGLSTPPWLRVLWNKNMSGTITPILEKLLREAALQYPRDEIEEAMRICIERGHYDFAYMAGILKKGVWEPPKHSAAKDGKRRYSEVPPVERKKYSIDDYLPEVEASP